MVTFSRDSLKTSPVRKRIRQGSPHVNKKNSILSFQTTDAMTDKYGYASRLCRHKPLTSNSSKSSSNSSSPDLERVPRNSILDCDADESSIGSSCSKCSTSSNGDDDVFYPNSYGDLHRGPPTPYNSFIGQTGTVIMPEKESQLPQIRFHLQRRICKMIPVCPLPVLVTAFHK